MADYTPIVFGSGLCSANSRGKGFSSCLVQSRFADNATAGMRKHAECAMSNGHPRATLLSARRAALPTDAQVAILGLIVILLLGSVFTATFIFVPAHSARASSSIPRVSCTGYCTAGVQWGNPIWGAAAEIQTQSLQGAAGSTIFNQLELIDVGHGCGSFASSFAAGYRTREDNTQTWYFWSQCRPGVDSAPIVNYAYQVPSNNYGFYFYYRMYRYDGTKYEIDFFYNGTYYWSGISQSVL